MHQFDLRGAGINRGEADIDLSGLIRRKPHVEIQLQVGMRVEHPERAPVMFDIIRCQFDNASPFAGIDTQ